VKAPEDPGVCENVPMGSIRIDGPHFSKDDQRECAQSGSRSKHRPDDPDHPPNGDSDQATTEKAAERATGVSDAGFDQGRFGDFGQVHLMARKAPRPYESGRLHLEASENPSDSGATDHQPENNESEADGQGLRDSLPGEDHCCGGHQGQPDDQVDPTGGQSRRGS